MLKYLKSIILVLILVSVLVLPCLVFADSPLERLEGVGGDAGYKIGDSDNFFPTMAGGIIKAFLALLGIIFLVFIIYAGVIWMTAAGNDDRIARAKNTIQRAIIGLLIVVGAYAITEFIILKILYAR